MYSQNNDKNKTNSSPPPSTPVTVFLIAEFEMLRILVCFYQRL